MLGIGNESLGLRRFDDARLLREPAQGVRALRAQLQHAQQKMQRIAVGPDSADTSYTKAVMEAWKNKVWAWDIEGISLHFYTVVKWPPAYKATGFGEDEYATLLNETRRMEELLRTHSAIMDQFDPEKKIALIVDEWGAWLAPTPGSPEGFLEQQNSQRDAHHRRAEHQYLRSPCGARARRQHRPDGQRAPGDDPHRQGKDVADADLPRFPHVPAVPGCDLAAGDGVGRGIPAWRLQAAARGCHRGARRQGKTWLAVSNLDPRRATRGRARWSRGRHSGWHAAKR